MTDLTIIYITANKLRESLASVCREQLLKAKGDAEIISVSKKPMDFGYNIVFDTPAGLINLYRETMAGVRQAKTKYVAIAEDDTLYSEQHFKLRPKLGHFAYDVSCWGVYTWMKPAIYSFKQRRNHNMLICERDLYLKELEERFAKYTDDSKIPLKYFAEPGRYNRQLGITTYPTQEIVSYLACVRFSHQDESLGMKYQGIRKAVGFLQAYDIPQWGNADKLVERYYR